MLRFRPSAAIAMVLIFLASYFAPELAFASSRARAQETIPQGQDTPGTDEQQQTPPPAEHKA